MIKIGIRQNLIYPTIFAFSSLFRDIGYIFMKNWINTNIEYYFLTLIMFISEFISGLILFKYHLNFMKGRKSKEDSTIMGIKLVKIKQIKKRIPDSDLVIYIYIFLITFFDFLNFVIKLNLLPNYHSKSNISYSPSIYIRLTVVLTFYSSFFSYFLLKIPIHKHQKCSLILLGFCFLYLLFTEFFISFLNDKSIDFEIFAFTIVFTILSQLFFSFIDIIEKYLLEYDFVNPFQMLMVEGIYGIILTIISFFIRINPIEIKKLNEIYGGELKKIFLLILFLIIYLVLSGIKNIYRVVTNKIYNPTTKNLFDILMSPLLLIIYFYYEKDYQNMKEKQHRTIIFISNLFVSFLIVFCCCVYNELFVLFCCGLEYNTHREISKRAELNSNLKELNPADDNDSDDGEYNM